MISPWLHSWTLVPSLPFHSDGSHILVSVALRQALPPERTLWALARQCIFSFLLRAVLPHNRAGWYENIEGDNEKGSQKPVNLPALSFSCLLRRFQTTSVVLMILSLWSELCLEGLVSGIWQAQESPVCWLPQVLSPNNNSASSFPSLPSFPFLPPQEPGNTTSAVSEDGGALNSGCIENLTWEPKGWQGDMSPALASKGMCIWVPFLTLGTRVNMPS